MVFVDTNYFLRFLLKDIDNQFKEAKQLFLKSAQGDISLTTSVIVFFEVVWVLRKSFSKDKQAQGKALRERLEKFWQLGDGRFLEGQFGFIVDKPEGKLPVARLNLPDRSIYLYSEEETNRLTAVDVKTGEKIWWVSGMAFEMKATPVIT